ncbi:MAG: aminotransferase class I/II-fold pyridoxal phosphate-dependent enzyme [Gemmatimonadota bacterium]
MTPSSWDAGSDRLAPFLSARGRAARMPDGIRVWGERAARAGALDATMGVITGSDGGIAFLPQVRAAFADWSPGEVFPYAPVAGVRAFRDGWRRWLAGKSAGGDFAAAAPLAERFTAPIATAGVSGALGAMGHVLLDPGDRVLVPDRRWDGYDTTFGVISGARVESVRLLDREAWDLAAWKAALEDVAREQERVVCVVNFPHNPTGYVPTAAEAEAFADLAADVAERSGKAVVVLCDDAYEGYVYTDRPRWSLFYRLVDRHPRLLPVKCDGITKELLFWGGRLGAITTVFSAGWDADARASAETVWENKLSAVIRGMISSASTPVQTLVARLLADPERLLAERAPLIALLVERRAALAAALETPAARAAFRPDPFHGGLFALLNLRQGEAVARAERLLAEDRIGVVPFRDAACDVNAIRVTYATVPTDRIAGLIRAAAT